MDEKHAQELKKLKEKGLTKICFHGLGGEYSFIVEERIQNKISLDLIGKGQELAEFLDRSADKPALCHLYKGTFMVNSKYLVEDEFNAHKQNEDNVLINCKEKVLKSLTSE